MNQQYIPSDAINEGIRGVIEFIPLVYVFIVVMTAIAFGIVKLDGTTVKNYKVWVIGIAISLGAVAFFFYPEDEVKVRDIPTLIVGCIASLFFVQLILFWLPYLPLRSL